MSGTPPLPDVLTTLITEFATPSFRLRDNRLQIHNGETTIVTSAKSGLWYVSWGPHIYLPPSYGSLRVILLHHENANIKNLPAITIQCPTAFPEKPAVLARSILFCSSYSFPLLNIETPSGILLPSIILSPDKDIIALVVRRYIPEIEKKAVDIVARKDERLKDVLKQLRLTRSYNKDEGFFDDLSEDDLSVLFTPAELKIMNLPENPENLAFQKRDEDKYWKVGVSFPDRSDKSYEFPQGFTLPNTQFLAALTNWGGAYLVARVPQLKEEYYKVLQRLEGF